MIEIKNTNNFNAEVELFVDGTSKGLFPTKKKAEQFLQKDVATISNSDTLVIETEQSGIVSQKNDEPPVKRRGRPRKADNDRTPVL